MTPQGSASIVYILQMRKLRHGEVTSCAQCHTKSTEWSQDSDPGTGFQRSDRPGPCSQGTNILVYLLRNTEQINWIHSMVQVTELKNQGGSRQFLFSDLKFILVINTVKTLRRTYLLSLPVTSEAPASLQVNRHPFSLFKFPLYSLIFLKVIFVCGLFYLLSLSF